MIRQPSDIMELASSTSASRVHGLCVDTVVKQLFDFSAGCAGYNCSVTSESTDSHVMTKSFIRQQSKSRHHAECLHHDCSAWKIQHKRPSQNPDLLGLYRKGTDILGGFSSPPRFLHNCFPFRIFSPNSERRPRTRSVGGAFWD